MISAASDNMVAVESRSNFDVVLRAFRIMLLSRTVEDKLASLYRSGMIRGGVFLGKGQEALSTASAIFLQRGKDIFGPCIRDQAGRLAFEDTVLDTLRTYFGSAQGSMRGRDGNIHRGHPKEGYYAMISHLGSMVAMVGGGLYARRLRGETGVVGVTSIGEGGTSTGAFHEGINFAAVEKLPLVVVIANNQYSYSTPNTRQFACEDLLDRAAGYGVAGHRAEGTDIFDCLRVLKGAVDAARRGEGPQMVVANLLRLVGHGEHDDGSYMDANLRKMTVGRDCIEVAREKILADGIATQAEIEEWTAEAVSEVETALNTAQREKGPNPETEKWHAISTGRLVDGHFETEEE